MNYKKHSDASVDKFWIAYIYIKEVSEDRKYDFMLY